MKRTTFSPFLWALTFAICDADGITRNLKSKIVGGEQSENGQFPYYGKIAQAVRYDSLQNHQERMRLIFVLLQLLFFFPYHSSTNSVWMRRSSDSARHCAFYSSLWTNWGRLPGFSGTNRCLWEWRCDWNHPGAILRTMDSGSIVRKKFERYKTPPQLWFCDMQTR